MFINRFASGPLMEEAGTATGTGLDKAAVDTMINGALTRFAKEVLPNTLKDFGKTQTDQLTALTTNLTTLQESINAMGTNTGGDKKKKDGEGEGTGDDGLTPAMRARLQNMERKQKETDDKLLAEQSARKEAETKQRLEAKQNAIRKELGSLDYASPEAAEDAFMLVNGKVEEDSDGNYIADGLPLTDFVKTYLPEKKPHLLAPVPRSGSGANTGQQPGQRVKKVQIDDISAKNLLSQDPVTGQWKFDAEKGSRIAQGIKSALA